MGWVRTAQDGCIIDIHVIPQGKRNEIIGLYNERLKIKIDAPPVDGKANECLIRFIADILKVKNSDVELIKGTSSRQKQLKVHNLNPHEVELLIFKRGTS